ncbi:DUF6412 domain-containing protein [Microbacterium suwonense]|uniref:Uncharacterized protein n=1 Tax=Microbacterium suwonense TaxID=683047 RepID=A0ABN6X916_9MICO|nr:DUF6412 domain-containing protein [Microbacterium suwonense]BDZ40517.1 hypothetical protein GCM10025863_31310 [Microbacterium suwonense]
MTEAIGSLLQLMLTALGVVPLPAGMTAGGMLGVAAILVAVAVIAIALTTVTPVFGIRSAPHPRRAIDVSTLLAQSDPDASGHPRPRAPGVASAA